jgi:hypothetical protein
MKAVGTILLIIGLVGTLLFGFQAIQDSESFSFLGIDIAVSKADWTPLIVSGIIFLIGLVMTIRKKG